MITTFEFAPGMSLRAISKDDQPWFIAKDVCDALGYTNGREAVATLDTDERITVTISDGNRGSPNRTVISESGLYSLIFRSKKPEAQKFRKWVTTTVLPAIRTGGLYYTGQETIDLASMNYEQAQAHIAELKAKVSEAEAIRWAKSREEKQARRDGFKLLRSRR